MTNSDPASLTDLKRVAPSGAPSHKL
jgi:hypothetical protein